MMDTIAAIATPLGAGALGIVRLSGPQSVFIAANFVDCSPSLKLASPRQALFSRIKDASFFSPTPNSQLPTPVSFLIDSAIVIKYSAPASFTGEEMVEITAHGSPAILRKILSLAIKHGAREALPGEFTQRAFLNGKLDLAQAEAICGLIRAQSDLAARLQSRIVDGELSRYLGSVLKDCSEAAALADVLIDHSDDSEIAPGANPEVLSQRLAKVAELLRGLGEGFLGVKKIREGARVAVIGLPNAGKSTLFNALLLKDRAIVTSEAGTTRDTIEEYLEIRGRFICLIDTAGFRQPQSQAETFGIERARRAIEQADFCLWVIDGAKGDLSGEERAIGAQLEKEKKPYCLIWNKNDLPGFKVSWEGVQNQWYLDSCLISARRADSIDQVRTLILASADKLFPYPSEITVTEERQAALLECAVGDLGRAQGHLQGQQWELLGLELRHALADGYSVLGQGDVSEEILRSIFSKFCIGK